MKHRLFCFLLLAACLLPSSVSLSQTTSRKLSAELRNMVAANSADSSATSSRLFARRATAAAAANSSIPRSVRALVKLQTGCAPEWLEKQGCTVMKKIASISVADIPTGLLAALADSSQVIRIETHTSGHLCLDTTAVHSNVADVYNGTALPQAFTGKGVLLGISDIGFDLTHPTFYNADGSVYRVRQFLDQSTAEAESFGRNTVLGAEYVEEEQILQKEHSADAYNELHGTHCLGIAAGSGYNTTYRGMAYESNICAVSSATGGGAYYSANEVALLKYIFDCADSLGMPCVVSYSIGFDYVPGDAVLYEEALDNMLGPGHILVAAAGNENRNMRYMHKKAGQPAAGTALCTTGKGKNLVFRIFCSGSFSLRLSDINDSNNGDTLISSSSLPTEPVPFAGNTLTAEQQDSIYTFRIVVNGDNRPMIGAVIEGDDVDAQLLADYYTVLYDASQQNKMLGNAESGHSVMLPGTLPNVIAVGAMCYHKNTSYGTYGQISNFSSQGATIDYRVKPDVVASGVRVMSAMNSFYQQGGGSDTSTFNGKQYKWMRMSGTSMATPAVAGIVALWMEAVPTLSPQQALDAIAHTSRHPVADEEYPNNAYGYGEIDAYKGLLYLLNVTAAIPQLSTHQPKDVAVKISGKTLTIETTDGKPVTTDIFALSGTRVARAKGQTSIDLSPLASGIYTVQLTGSDNKPLGSLLIRL